MTIRLGVAIAMVTAVLGGVSRAEAATEVGNRCKGEISLLLASSVFQATEASSNPLPLAVPSSGVITRWRVNNGREPIEEKLKVFRPTPSGVRVVGESELESIPLGDSTSYETRIGVQAGDRIGVFGGPALICPGGTGDEYEGFFGDTPVGFEGPTALQQGSARVAVAATVEPDRDGDGYGDETQDKCARRADTHDECPFEAIALQLDAFPIVLKRSILVLVSANESSSVQVFGQVGWRPRHKGGALASKSRKPNGHLSTGVIVGLSGGTTLVKPGEVTPFNVKLPKSVLRHLGRLAPKRVVKGTITARTTDLAGQEVDRIIPVRLHGRRAAAKHRPRP